MLAVLTAVGWAVLVPVVAFGPARLLPAFGVLVLGRPGSDHRAVTATLRWTR